MHLYLRWHSGSGQRRCLEPDLVGLSCYQMIEELGPLIIGQIAPAHHEISHYANPNGCSRQAEKTIYPIEAANGSRWKPGNDNVANA